jgi:hypothetical protein
MEARALRNDRAGFVGSANPAHSSRGSVAREAGRKMKPRAKTAER